jgi:hypothetical protein
MAQQRKDQTYYPGWVFDRDAWGIELPDDLDWAVSDAIYDEPRFAIYGSTRDSFIPFGEFRVRRECWAFIDLGANLLPEGRAAERAAIRAAIPGIALHLRIEDGVRVIESLTLVRRPGGLPITATSYKKFNLRTLVDQVSRWTSLVADEETGDLRYVASDETPELTRRLEEHRKASRPGRGTRLSDEYLQVVADVYKAALASGSRSPTADVSKQLNTARSNAGRYVAEARRRGILGKATPGQAGEKGT